MFSPPPVQLSVAQIEQAKIEREKLEESRLAKEEEKRQGKEKKRSFKKERSRKDDIKSVSSHDENKGSVSFDAKSLLFRRRTRSSLKGVKVSSPILNTTNPSSADANDIYNNDARVSTEQEDSGKGNDMFRFFGQETRKASIPPRRPARPSPERSLIDQPQLYRSAAARRQSPARSGKEAASVSARSSSRKLSTPSQMASSETWSSAVPTLKPFADSTLAAAFASINLGDDVLHTVLPQRATTAPPAPGRSGSITSLPTLDTTSPKSSRRVAVGSSTEKKRPTTIYAGKIDKGKFSKRPIPRDGKSGSPRSRSAPELRFPWKRSPRGESMSMLIDRGFFPERDLEKIKARALTPLMLPSLESLVAVAGRDLPDTPNSIVSTPIEMYNPRPNSIRTARPVSGVRKSRSLKRSPWPTVTSTSSKATSYFPVASEDDVSPTRRAAPSRRLESISEHTPPGSEATTPLASEMHIVGGSVLTVVPPELTAWKRSIYIPGPIRLPKPSVMPRHNSVASLDAFQIAVTHTYRGGDGTGRRRSDDKAVDDICEWFDQFGFEEVRFAGDILVTEHMDLDDIHETNEASPMEKAMAKGVVETNELFRAGGFESRRSSVVPQRKQSLVVSDGTRIMLQPASTTEELRMRGIARLSKSRKFSVVSTASSGVLPVTPTIEEGMIESAFANFESTEDSKIEEVHEEPATVEIEDIEEIKPDEAWLSPVSSPTTMTSPKSPLSPSSPGLSVWELRMRSRHSANTRWHVENARNSFKTI